MSTPLNRPVTRITNNALDGSYGSDRHRKLVVTLAPGDLIVIRPMGTRRPETLSLLDLYRMAVRYRVNCERLSREREKLAKRAAAKKTRALAREVKREQGD